MKCKTCSKKLWYNESYDAYFCINCCKWTESACNDPKCSFCRNRPPKPNQEKTMKPIDAGPLGLHFKKLLKLKEFVKKKLDAHISKKVTYGDAREDIEHSNTLTDIYNKLDALIKNGEKPNE